MLMLQMEKVMRQLAVQHWTVGTLMTAILSHCSLALHNSSFTPSVDNSDDSNVRQMDDVADFVPPFSFLHYLAAQLL